MEYACLWSDKSITERKKDVLIAARNLFESTAGTRNKRYYRAGVNFEFQQAFHFGDSANLAISAIWFTRLLEASHQRELYKLHSHSVITGNVDKEGNVRPVDRESVSLKVQAAYFSWGKILVVPAVQRDLFEQELGKLREKYPTRNLVLYGADHLREIFFDRRLASHQVEGFLSFYFKQMKSQKYRAVTVPLILVLIGVIGWLIFGPVDQNPVDGEFSGTHLILNNQYGQRIAALEAGSEVVRLEQANESITNKFGLFDLNSDGTNEVIFARSLEVADGTNGEQLVAYSVSGDSVIWARDLMFNIDFPNKTDVSEDLFRLHSVNYAERSAESEHFLIANVGHRNFFPSIILKMNPDNGNELGRYIHTGRIAQTLTEDIDSDGMKEVLALGQNNAFDEITVFFALETDQIKGHSPLTEEYMVSGYQRARKNSISGFRERLSEMHSAGD